MNESFGRWPAFPFLNHRGRGPRLGLILVVLALGTAFPGSTRADDFQPLWKLGPGDRPYLTTDNTQRGVAYNPVTGHVLLVNRSGGTSVPILDAQTGADLGTLDV